tara:strand:+ start:590 stop:985 length:396 start_codon:yes stop_codon:yes gene_type:complete
MISKKLINQLIFFFIAGTSAVLVDFIVYKITLETIGIFSSKLLGFYSGVFISFIINSSYTFSKDGKKLLNSFYFFKYFSLLTATMMINVGTNYFIFKNFSSITNIRLIAFLLATFISMLFNFFNLKFWVFK